MPEIGDVWFWAVFSTDGIMFEFFFYSVRNFLNEVPLFKN